MPGARVEAGPGATPEPTAAFEGIDLAIVLPTLDEEEGLRRMVPELPLERLRSIGWRVRPLVIDGGSRDRTREVAAEFGIPVLMQRGRGKGAAIQEALSWLNARGVAYAVTLDADCTYPGSAISPMVALLEAGADLVVGVRYPAAAGQGGPTEAIHRWGNALLNLSASLLTHRPIIDLCSGLWGVRLSEASGLDLQSVHFEVEAELFVKAARRGLTVNQIPIEYRQRVGQAKLRAVRDGVQIFLTLLRYASTPSHPPRASAATPRFVRSLLAVCFVHRAERVELHAPSDRREEAEAMARGLRRGGLEPAVLPTPEERARDPFVGAPPLPLPEAAEGPRSVVVTLPSRAGRPSETPTALAHVPSRGRLVVLGGPVGQVPEWLAGLPERGYRPMGSNAAPSLLAPVYAAHASISAKRPRQEAALLRANAYHAPVRIYVRDSRAPAPRASSPGPVRAGPADPEASP